jgi:hypothetical protein
MDDSIIVLSSLQFSDMEKYMGSEFRAVGMISVNRSIQIGEVERESEKIIEKSLPIQSMNHKLQPLTQKNGEEIIPSYA